MKKHILIIGALTLSLTLTGCASGFVGHPDTMADGTDLSALMDSFLRGIQYA